MAALVALLGLFLRLRLGLLRLQVDRDRVDAVPQTGGVWAVIKYMPQMGIATTAMDFRPSVEEFVIGGRADRFVVDWLKEAWPARSRLIFCLRVKQGLTAAHAGVRSVAFVVPKLARESAFGSVFAGESDTMSLRIENLGEAELEVDFRPVASFTPGTPSLDLVPSSFRTVEITFSPEMEGPIDETLVLETNDPDSPLVMVRLTGEGVLPPRMDAGMPDAFVPDAGPGDAGVDASRPGVTGGGCGCRTGTGGDAASGLLFLLLLLRRRR